MTDWFVSSLGPNGKQSKSRALPSEDAALSHSLDLKRQHHMVDRFEGPDLVAIWLDHAALAKLNHLRRPGESYSEAILALPEQTEGQ
jgi:hypothetical protein